MINRYKSHIAKTILFSGMLLFVLMPEKANSLQKTEPRKRIKVFLLAGQSNMEGRVDAHKLSPEDNKRLLRIRNNVRLAYNYEGMKKLGQRFAEVFLKQNKYAESHN